MVRLSPFQEKTEILPGAVFEVGEKQAVYLVSAYRGTFVQSDEYAIEEIEEIKEKAPKAKRVTKRHTQELKDKEIA